MKVNQKLAPVISHGKYMNSKLAPVIAATKVNSKLAPVINDYHGTLQRQNADNRSQLGVL